MTFEARYPGRCGVCDGKIVRRSGPQYRQDLDYEGVAVDQEAETRRKRAAYGPTSDQLWKSLRDEGAIARQAERERLWLRVASAPGGASFVARVPLP